MALFYCAYKYNILFVTDSKIDTKGLIYPRALQQLLTGIYIAELCLIGLFGIAAAIGPIILMVAFLVFTILFHISLNAALDPLMYNLPLSLEAEEESLLAAEAGAAHQDGLGPRSDSIAKENVKADSNQILHPPTTPRKRPNILSAFLRPHIYADYSTLRALVPRNLLDPTNLYTPDIQRNAYHPPSVTSEVPLLWIPRDEAGISRQEIGHVAKVLPITDEGAMFDGKGALVWDAEGGRPPLWREKVYY